MAVVRSLHCYPVKSCAAMDVPAIELTGSGVRHDRVLMLVDPDGRQLTQRQVPRMAAIRPVIAADSRLTLSAPGVHDVELDALADGSLRAVSIFDEWFGDAVDQGDTVAEWFGAVLDLDCRLVGLAPGHQRDNSGAAQGLIHFTDSNQVHLLSTASLDGLNDRIAQRGGDPLPMNRFRPNVVVDGWPEPHTEDRVRELTVGDVRLAYSKPAIRCSMPPVEQETGTRRGPEPNRTLSRYRRRPEGGVSFGIHTTALRTGVVAVGDEVVVHAWA